MPNEPLEAALNQKMAAEQKAFEEKLLKLSPQEILKKSREYVMRDNILIVLNKYPGTEEQTRLLLQSETPLANIYAEIDRQGSDYGINEIKDCIEVLTEALLRAEAEKRDALRNLPVYPYPGEYAREHGELEQYRTSYKANVACRDAIEAAIRDNYAENTLDTKTAVKQVADAFDYPRMLHVLANTIKQKDWDGRISPDNKRWAATQHVFEDKDGFGTDRNIYFIVDRVHPGLTDMFATAARKNYLLSIPLATEEIRTEAQRLLDRLKVPTEPNSPNKTHFMAEIDPLFLQRAGSNDMAILQRFLPFKSLALTTMKDRKGVFAVISHEEDRAKKLREPRPSVLQKLEQSRSNNSPNNSAKKREMEL